VNAGIGVDMIDAGGEVTGFSRSDQRSAPPTGVETSAENTSARRALAALRGELPADLLRKRVFGSDFVFAGVERAIPLEGPWLPRSLARGGLANVWGAGCYPLRAEDYADWPVEPDHLHRWFSPAMRLLHVSGSHDGLSRVYDATEAMTDLPVGDGPDPGSPFETLLGDWRHSEEALARSGLHAGRARLAVRPRSSGDPGACEACGQCLEGCPVEAIWNGRGALDNLVSRGLQHLSGTLVRQWRAERDKLWLDCGEPEAPATRLGPYDALFLAAGPLSTFRIAAQSVPDAGAVSARLAENDVIVLPFVFRQGITHAERRFTLSEAVVAIDPAGALERPAHLQLYRPGGATLGPLSTILERLPSSFSALLLRGIKHLAIGMLYLHGAQSRSMRLRLLPGDAPITPIEVTSKGTGMSIEAARTAIRRLSAARRLLALSPIALAQRRGGPGFSAHLGGALPMRHRPDRLECHPDGRLAGATGSAPVFVVDLSAFPEMPAQNPTLTGVANAMRIAAQYAAVGH
jgi:choline dehydrogenase-like flavoprotein